MTSTPRLPAVLAPLTSPAYRRLLWSSALWWQTLSMWTVVAGVLVLDMTDSALAVAMLTFWRRAAQLLLGGFAGPIGDRLGRRTTLLVTQSCVFSGSLRPAFFIIRLITTLFPNNPQKMILMCASPFIRYPSECSSPSLALPHSPQSASPRAIPPETWRC